MKLGSLNISDSDTKDIISELNSESDRLEDTEELQKLMVSIKGQKQNILKVSKKK